jgi:O-antigen ligase
MSSRQKRKNSASFIPVKGEPLFNQLLVIVIAISATVIPFTFDSFTASKLLVASFGLLIFSINFLRLRSTARINVIPRTIVILVTSYFLALVFAWWKSDVPFIRGAFGQFGRGNGLFYYFFSILILIFSIKTITFADRVKANKLVTYFSWFLALYAALQRLGIDIAQLDTKGISPVVLTYGNSNFAGGMLAMLFTYHLIHAVTAKKFPTKTILLLFLLLVSSTFPAAVQGYLIILFAIALAISLYIYQRYKSHWVLKTILASWISVVLLIALGLKGTFILARIFDRPSFQARIEYWRIAIKIILDYPFFGVGPDKLYDLSANYMSPGSLKVITTTRMDNAHNWYLNLAANFGLIALILLSLILFAVFIAGFRLVKERNNLDPFSVASFAAFCGMFIDGLVSLEQPGLGIWLYFLAGVTIGNSLKTNKPENKVGAEISKSSVAQKNFQRIVSLVPIVALVISTAVTSTRVFQDALLRNSIQTQLSDGGQDANLERIASGAVALKAEPEYSIQAIKYLAMAGDGGRIERVSYATYDYYKGSIQATLLRADVLRALGRIDEACPLRVKLIDNTPWDMHQIEAYLICLSNGFIDKNYMSILTEVAEYFSPMEISENLETETNLSELNLRFEKSASQARLNSLIGNQKKANQGRDIALKLITRIKALEKVKNLSPTQSMRVEYLKLLDF